MSKSKAVGNDPGTMFFQTAEFSDDQIKFTTIRNAFIELAKTEDINQVLKQNSFQYVEDDKNVYVIGEDAIRFAQMLPGKIELRRPLQNGVLNPNEEQKMLVLNELVRSTIGTAPDKNSVVCFCVSSPPLDDSPNNVFHERRLKGMFENLGWQTKVIEEGLAVVLSENPSAVDSDGKTLPATGIGVSFGSGRVNIVVAYKGIVGIGMSIGKCGDWLDAEVSSQLNIPVSQVTKFKETKLNFDNINEDSDLEFALDAYYSEMLRYVFEKFAHKFRQEMKNKEGGYDFPIDLIVAGGTSMPKGFINKVKRVIRNLDLPFEIKDVVHAKDPRNAVAKGLLMRAELSRQELESKESNEL